MVAMFDLDTFIADCVTASAESETLRAVKEVLDRALADSPAIADALPGDPGGEFTPVHTSDTLSIFKIVWVPGMSVPPHDHLMPAVIGIYGGEEDNEFFRRSPEGIVASGGKRIGTAESTMLGSDVIHAVTNPSARVPTGSIHIYAGDFLTKQRSMWDADTLEEGPADGETVRRLFQEAHAAYLAGRESEG
jgi:predicted metal-dependent enzyme (double-stranded beta helix superfamily)